MLTKGAERRALRGGLATLGICAAFGALNVHADQPAADWPMYGRDHAGTRFAPLDQINTTSRCHETRP